MRSDKPSTIQKPYAGHHGRDCVHEGRLQSQVWVGVGKQLLESGAAQHSMVNLAFKLIMSSIHEYIFGESVLTYT